MEVGHDLAIWSVRETAQPMADFLAEQLSAAELPEEVLHPISSLFVRSIENIGPGSSLAQPASLCATCKAC